MLHPEFTEQITKDRTRRLIAEAKAARQAAKAAKARKR
ncbi:hypothetical protein BTM25_38440 [Actinomadura rubteroloni]|uniref:Uncharacterized protein n=1 Tax=Actinomadura rubteroloni TaxID=1926885 RepID=A0A2P4UJI3_9ACTN|nr:hypothetical protein BTM25_38440 [Actinomadura rubteroloni]